MIKRFGGLVKVFALVLIVLGVPFYLGYGNPLPFVNPEYSAFENLWLTVFPLSFVGLALGWRFEKLAGYWLVLVLGLGFVVSVFLEGGFPLVMLLPFVVGLMYLVVGYKGK